MVSYGAMIKMHFQARQYLQIIHKHLFDTKKVLRIMFLSIVIKKPPKQNIEKYTNLIIHVITTTHRMNIVLKLLHATLYMQY